jgi:hypothetical protein
MNKSFPQARLSEDAVRSFLDAMVAHGYMLSDGGDYLSLALRLQPFASVTDEGPRERMVAEV